MQTIYCSGCGMSIGEDEVFCPFCDESIYDGEDCDWEGDESELLEEYKKDLYEAYGKIRKLQAENTRLKKKLQKLSSPEKKK